MSILTAPMNRLKARVAATHRQRLLDGRFSPTVSVGSPADGHAKVVMCLWNRPSRLGPIIEMLANQTGTEGIDLYLWNNARSDHAAYEAAVRAADLTGAVRSVQLVKAPFNLGSIARFYLVRQLAQRGYAGPVIVLDDDEDVTPGFVASALAQYDPAAITAWWAFRRGASYWDRTPALPGEQADHIGPGGSVSPARFFLDDGFFTELPLRFWLLDDLWLTSYASRHGLELRKLDVEIEFVMDETNQYPTVANLKNEFYDYLNNPAN